MSDERFVPDPEVMVTDLNNELVLLHGQTSQMYSLNAAARTVWLRLPARRPELLTALVEAFEVEEGQAAVDLDALLHDLQRLNMVQRAGT